MKSPFNIPIGTVIRGKWHNQSYTIIRELGRGANGIVYLADWQGKKVAIKVSDYNVTITSEVNVLKSFSKAQGVTLGPSLLDVDDWYMGNTQIFFYCMEFIEGNNFLTFIERNGKTWLPVLILQLLADLENLHRRGWVFGDLKPDNLIITGPPIKIRCIDVGGTTLKGRAIKEFTEFYDRGYWGLGSRKAEPTYDLFAIAMIIINAYYPQRFTKQSSGIDQLKKAIEQKAELNMYKPVLISALLGKYQSANEMRQQIIAIVNQPVSNTNHANKHKIQGKQKVRKQTIQVNRTRGKKRKKKGSFLETIFILTLICILYIFYVYEQLM